jgi:hypothetical protein
MPAALGALAPAAVVPAPVLGANEPEAVPPAPEPLTIVPTAPLPLAKIGCDIIEPTPAVPPLTLLAQPPNDSHPAMPVTRSPTFNEPPSGGRGRAAFASTVMLDPSLTV